MADLLYSVKSGLQAGYDGLAGSRDQGCLYFTTDTQRIYRGDLKVADALQGSVITGADDSTAFPASGQKQGVFYVNTTTFEIRVFNGTNYVKLTLPVETALTDTSDEKIPTSKAVGDYVKQKIQDVTGGTGFVKKVEYSKETHQLTITGGEAAGAITLDGFGVELEYNPSTGDLTLKDSSGTVLGETINLDLERFVSAAAYDSTNKQILLAFNDVVKIDTGASYSYPDSMPASPAEGTACRATDSSDEDAVKWYWYTSSAWSELPSDETPLQIEVGSLVDTYTAGNTQSITMSVIGNQFTANVNRDTVTGSNNNVLQITEHGLYVAPTDLSTCMKLVSSAVEDNIATFGTNGQVKDSGKKIGGATLAGTANANTLATEAAVKAVADTKLDKTSVETVFPDEASDDKVPSTKLVRTALAAKVDATLISQTITNESTKIPSNAAVYNALLWKEF